ncbi:MAG: GntR family transcriptional regulator [Eubacteriales bacterium]|nr:GntR family transcriptional regulator [Eubacteriales bacterium]MDD4389185.1 GntR family transcriptional regulator [Eubacteriales bacterium]
MILQGNPDKDGTLSLSESLFRQLRTDILQEKLKIGEKLTEQRICSDYSVSRTPVREAFQKLEIDGLIETIPNRGAFVVGFTEKDMADMYELRKAYEIQAIKWAVERMTHDEFDEIEETFEFMEFYTNKRDFAKMQNINSKFHSLIYAASHNKMLIHFLSSYQLYIKYRHKPVNSEEYLLDLLEDHRLIYEALRERDLPSGVAAMSLHMNNVKSRAGI